MTGTVHAAGYSGNDVALCGDAYDAYETGDLDAPVVIASVGETVTCTECRAIITYARNAFTRSYRAKTGEVVS